MYLGDIHNTITPPPVSPLLPSVRPGRRFHSHQIRHNVRPQLVARPMLKVYPGGDYVEIDNNLGWIVQAAQAAAAIYSMFGKKKSKTNVNFYEAYHNLQPGDYITNIDPTPGRATVSVQSASTPSAPTPASAPPTPIAPQQLPPSPQTTPAPTPTPAPTAQPVDYTMPLVVGGGLLLLALSQR